MAGGVEVAQAYITIIPSMKGIQGTIAKELNADIVGQKAGKALGSGILSGSKKSSADLMKSFSSVGDRIAFKTETGISTAFSNIADGAKQKMSGVASTIGDKFKAVGTALSNTGVGKAFTGIATAGAAAFTKITGTVRGVASFIGSTFSTVAGAVKTHLAPVGEVAKAVFGKIGSAAGSAFSAIGKAALAGSAVAVAGIAAITKSSLEGYASYEQLAGGAEKIFSGIDYHAIELDAQAAYKTMGMSANEYLESINQVGASFKATMGDEKGYTTAKRGMKAISDYASGTGRSVSELNEKYSMITRSTSSYQSIADQFSGLLPATSEGFLKAAQSAGLLSTEYTSLTEVPIAEYQQAVTGMMEKGTEALGLTGNTANEAYTTISGSLGLLRGAWDNFVVELGKGDGDIEARVGELVEAAVAVISNVGPRIVTIVGSLAQQVPPAIMAQAPVIGQALTQMLDGVTNGGFSRVVEAIRPYAERIGAAASGMWDRLKPLAPVVKEIGSKLGGILLKGLSVATGAFEAIAPIIANIAEHALPILSSALDVASQAFDAIMQVMEPVATFLTDTFSAAIDWIGTKLEELMSWVSESFGAIGEAAGAVGDFLKDPLGSIADFAKKATSAFDKTADSATKSADKASKNTKKGYSEVNKAVTDNTAKAASAANKNMASASNSISSSTSKASSSASTNMGRVNSSVTDNTSKAAANASKNMGSLSSSVSRQGGDAASSAEKNGKRIETAWDRSYTTKMDATANTSSAEYTMQTFKDRWSGFSVSGNAYLSTSSASSTLSDWIYRNNNFVIQGRMNITNNPTLHTQGYVATGGILVQKHAQGFIANRRNTGVEITHHIVGENGAEAIIPLTNKAYVAPFARTVADFVNDGRGSGVVVTGNTFVVRKESDIAAIGRAINQQANRQRGARL